MRIRRTATRMNAQHHAIHCLECISLCRLRLCNLLFQQLAEPGVFSLITWKPHHKTLEFSHRRMHVVHPERPIATRIHDRQSIRILLWAHARVTMRHALPEEDCVDTCRSVVAQRAHSFPHRCAQLGGHLRRKRHEKQAQIDRAVRKAFPIP